MVGAPGQASERSAGNVAAAEALIDEDRLVADITGNPPVAYTAMLLACFQGRVVTFADYASAVLYNGLGRHDAARDAARRVLERDVVGYATLVIVELAEAASRTGDDANSASARAGNCAARLSQRSASEVAGTPRQAPLWTLMSSGEP
jgi:hypothetical protein